MKKIIFILLSTTVAFVACKKSSTTYMNTATIKGPNLTMPACGAAYLITIHGIADSGAQFNTLPSGSGIDLSTATFPINIRLNWHHNTGNFCDTAVNIISIDAMANGY